jgi:purine-binding chemotaxis protein CheW
MAEEKKTGYEIGTILREMREEYWKGLEESPEVEDEEIECVVFTLGGETYAFETIHAAEVVKIPKLIKVPRVQETIAGVFNLRGEITAALDIRPLLGLPRIPLTDAGRILVVKGEKFLTGLLAEAVRGVVALSYASFEPVAKSMPVAHRDLIRGQVRHKGELVILLDIARLLTSDEILH